MKTTDGRALRAKNPGTGLLDTPSETWRALLREYVAGADPLPDVAKRHGVRYSAALRRVGWFRVHWYGLRGAELLRTLPSTEVRRLNRAHEDVRDALRNAPRVAECARTFGLPAPPMAPLEAALRSMPAPPQPPTWPRFDQVPGAERPEAQVLPFRAPPRSAQRRLGGPAKIIDLRSGRGALE